jgi:hypothetical protein
VMRERCNAKNYVVLTFGLSTFITGTPAGGCTYASTIPDENRRERR